MGVWNHDRNGVRLEPAQGWAFDFLSSEALPHFLGMNGRDVVVAFEVVGVVGEDAMDPMNSHRGHETGIMNLNSLYFVLDEESAPLRINSGSIVQERQYRVEAT